MSSVASGHRHRISRISNQVGLRRESGVGIQALVSGRWQASPAYIRPEISRFQNNWCGVRVVRKTARERIEPYQTYVDSGTDQLAADFIIRDLRYDDKNSGQPESIEPCSTGITMTVSRSAACESQRRAIEHDDSRHCIGLITAFESGRSSLSATSSRE